MHPVPLQALKGSTEPELPNQQELQTIKEIIARAASEKKWPADVAGELRILRFLRGCDGVADTACQLVSDFLEWRCTAPEGVEALRSAVVDLSLEQYSRHISSSRDHACVEAIILGRSRSGDLVQLVPLGKWNVEKAVTEVGYLSLMRGQIEKQEWTMAYLDRLSRVEGRVLYQLNIMDLAGLGMEMLRGQARAFGLDLTRKFTRHYRDAVSVVILVNSPIIFRVAWGIISPLLTKRQLAKFRVLGKSSDPLTQEVLRATIPEDVLPEYLGGRHRRSANAKGSVAIPGSVSCDAEVSDEAASWPCWFCVGRGHDPAPQPGEDHGIRIQESVPSRVHTNSNDGMAATLHGSSNKGLPWAFIFLLGLVLALFCRSWSFEAYHHIKS
eukprot:gnl/MRDRNA2_/MRDRNA2_124437_c0_seq1.p1 gnl/MRDRNA2_/MRDRNA2_124437_c0~~gnl/MRDRNA2_/MRDRNA2_124437_c0_seq1.p1  ORF type:complete len:384 (+),score=46.26 gnl/MRDRNA2_/MRDRNA2_124437_c0_seq1:42-1193(+)